MSHLRDIVHPHRLDTVGILVASREPCIRIAVQEMLNQSGRRFLRMTPEALPPQMPGSWAMAVVLCRGDDTAELSAWTARHPRSVSRLHFYIHAGADPRLVLRDWQEAGLPLGSTWDIASWRDLAKHFGARMNMQCHDDFCAAEDCPFA